MDQELKDIESRRRIRENTGSGMAVEAAAGTGKTTEMVNRIVNLVGGGAPIGKIVAVTFTEKAAAELELRVRQRLEKLMAGDAGKDPDRSRWISEAVARMDTAQISTFHALALAMTRERPVEAGVDPEAAIMDEMEQALDFNQSWEEWLESLDGDKRRVLARAARMGLPVESIRDLAGRLAENRDVAQMLDLGRADQNALLEKVKEVVAQSQGLLQDCDARIKDREDAGYLVVRSWAEAVGSVLDEPEPEGVLERFMRLDPGREINLGVGRAGSYSDKGFNKERKERLKAIREIMAPEAKSLIGEAMLSEVLELLRGFVEYDWDRRRAEGRMNFQDVLIQARELLKNEDAKAYFREKWDYLLVDEFQDTDPLQAEIVSLLFEGRESGVFIVGDPKQSIYRFRRADIAVYTRTMEDLIGAAGTERETLWSNFRSVPPLVEWVNREFSRIILPDPPFQADYVPMAAARKAAPTGDGKAPPPISVLQPAEEGCMSAPAGVQMQEEALALARLILHLVEGGYQVYDPDERAYRPLTWRHVAVLYVTRPGNPDQWVQPFAELGIPFVSDLSRHFYTREEVTVLRTAMRALDRPADSLALFGLLRSPMFGFSDQELLCYRLGGGRLDFREEPGPGFEDLAGAFALLRELHQNRNNRPVSETMEMLLDRTGARISSIESRKDDSGIANIERMIARARSFHNDRREDFSAFVARLDELAELEIKQPEPVTIDPDENFVRLSTVHSAKGLEFPVVILANLGRRSAYITPALIADRVGRTAAAGIKDFHGRGFERLVEEDKRHHQEELKRLLYVAATRARDALVISVFPPLDPEKPARSSGPIYGPLPDYITSWSPESFGQTKEGVYFWDPAGIVPPKKAGRAAPDRDERAASLEEFTSERARVMDHAAQGVEVVIASALERFDDDRLSAGKDIPRRGPEDDSVPLKLGLAVHAVMEEVDLAAAAAPPELCRRKAAEAGVEMLADEVERLANNCLKSPLLKRAAASERVEREVPYCCFWDGAVHEGKIDLIFREGDRLVIVDYKTDRVPPERVENRADVYRGQAGEYREAAKRAAGAGLVEVWLVFAGPGVEVEVR